MAPVKKPKNTTTTSLPTRRRPLFVRVTNGHKYMPYGVALAFYICMSTAVVGLFAWQWTIDREQDHHRILVCEDSKINREAIRDSLKRSFSNLGYVWNEEAQDAVKSGPPGLAYYREHPEEVPLQLERLRQELDGFPPIQCEGGS